MAENKDCRNCGGAFSITDGDQAFYSKMAVPSPTFCPDCRLQRRLAFRNEHYLHQRSCDSCQKSILSFFPKNVPFPVYCPDCWWSDKWDPRDYGQDYDFNRPFFHQFVDLLKKVPKIGMIVYKSENCDYNTLIGISKNCYMSPGTYNSEDCYYVRKSQYSNYCIDGLLIDHCELVYQGVNAQGCYHCQYVINCRNCNDSAYLADCISCNNCFMCSGLTRQEYCIQNKSYNKEEYLKKVVELKKQPPETLLKQFFEFNKTIPKKYQNQINCENSSGDYIQNCKNAKHCYDCYDLEDGKHLIEVCECKDMMDCLCFDKKNELCYEICSGGDANVQTAFGFCPVNTYNCRYLYNCVYVRNCFGCDSIPRRMEYCVLNKQYSQEEYEALLTKVVDHMKSTGEYGEFFPIRLSLFPYNESMAQDYFPLTKEEAAAKRIRWRDPDPRQYQPQTYVTPKSIGEVPDSVVNEVLACNSCGKNYKIISQELAFYRKGGIPLPSKCPLCRHKERLTWKSPRKLWDRTCGKCGTSIQTTTSPERPERVYCEKCYLAEVR